MKPFRDAARLDDPCASQSDVQEQHPDQAPPFCRASHLAMTSERSKGPLPGFAFEALIIGGGIAPSRSDDYGDRRKAPSTGSLQPVFYCVNAVDASVSVFRAESGVLTLSNTYATGSAAHALAVYRSGARFARSRGGLTARDLAHQRNVARLRRIIQRKHGLDAQLLRGDGLRSGRGRDHREIAQRLSVLDERDGDER